MRAFHSLALFVPIVLAVASFPTQLTAQSESAAVHAAEMKQGEVQTLVEAGEEVYSKVCAACHQATWGASRWPSRRPPNSPARLPAIDPPPAAAPADPGSGRRKHWRSA